METITIKAGETEHTVETKPITLVCHDGTMEITPKDSDIMVIDPQSTVRFSDDLANQPKDAPFFKWNEIRDNEQFIDFFKTIFTDQEPPENLASASLAVRHVVGMIMLIMLAIAAGKRPFVKLPESYLHPKYQLGLADFFVKTSANGQLMNSTKTATFVDYFVPNRTEIPSIPYGYVFELDPPVRGVYDGKLGYNEVSDIRYCLKLAQDYPGNCHYSFSHMVFNIDKNTLEYTKNVNNFDEVLKGYEFVYPEKLDGKD